MIEGGDSPAAAEPGAQDAAAEAPQASDEPEIGPQPPSAPSSRPIPGLDGAPPQTPAAFGWLVTRWPRFDDWLYPAFVAVCVLTAARVFYGAMLAQTHGAWSAPLDDAFIHFDYARSAARGHPFEWTEGDGFSSGSTSLTYPLVLALGYWIAARGMAILVWAAVVACASTFAFLWASGRLFDGIGRWAKYLAPAAVLAVGAVDWTLFSGMENAFHLAIWGGALLAAAALADATSDREAVRRAWVLGVIGAILFATRPESVVCVACFAAFGASAMRPHLGRTEALLLPVRAIVPTAVTLVVLTVACRVFTGEWTQTGALVKLALYNPYMSVGEKLAEYGSLLKYVVLRTTQHHLSDALPWGWLPPLLALLPLAAPKVRALAITLWAQILGWLLLIALNGQVRWQNERYAMPAVAWLMLLAALGVATLVSRDAWKTGPLARVAERLGGARMEHPLFIGRIGAAALVVAIFWAHQHPNLRDQAWFFGRASRNVHDQHLVTGAKLRRLGANRVLVGDAGAIVYAGDIAGLDLIGLGNYRDLPFARAGVFGLGASLELIERMPPRERPDFLAIYPSWWGDLPGLFGRRVDGTAISGNVICGDAEDVIYRADWSSLDRSGKPKTLRAGEKIVDELDVADLVSERAHDYAFPRPGMGYVDFRVLPTAPPKRDAPAAQGAAPASPPTRARDLFDAGRVIPAGQEESAKVDVGRGHARIVVRTIATRAMTVDVLLDDRDVGALQIPRTHTWTEPTLALPPDVTGRTRVKLRPRGGDLFDAHVWVLEAGAP